MREITAAEFKSEVIQSNVPTLLKWTAKWCAPCRAMEPVLEKLAAEVGDRVKFVSIDVDDAHELAGEYSIRSIPKLMLFQNGEDVREHTGSASRETILKLIEG